MNYVEQVRPNGGPSWKWLAGIALSIIGAGLSLALTFMWVHQGAVDDKLASIATSIAGIQADVAQIKEGQLEQNTAAAKLWDKFAADHERLVEDDTLLHNWVHPDKR